ncbi:L,D-transpeptidase family protein [Kineosporia babensis]|uniref:L,D-transpeptidase family protein n=1 Tax=Kineosporia babensis TaxID=499548 RepID=A0A9X1STH5_9ACTN|nr:L,D-transpeptidase family protein [Kineosporia babensis]MCD5311321.1 L,D-transpeptidase family protein [Kineosporia babensis]
MNWKTPSTAALLASALVVTNPVSAPASVPTSSVQTSMVVIQTRPTLDRGDSGPAVRQLQKKLNALGYWTGGKADGEFGGNTEQAVFALEKVARLKPDGVVGPKVWRALEEQVRPRARSSRGTVVEVDKKRQVLKIVKDGKVRYTLNTSTGSGERYVSGGSTHIASTPKGHYRVFRQIDGYRHAPLGLLYRPKYFNGGIAVHGANSVPTYPASHGCVRVSNAAADWIWDTGKMPIGTKVWVY